jgi:CHAT domain-containing protein
LLSSLLTTLLDIAIQGDDSSIIKILDEHSNKLIEIQKEFDSLLEKYATGALSTPSLYAAYRLGSHLYYRLGNFDSALRYRLIMLNIMFMTAENTQEYEFVRESLYEEIVSDATNRGLDHLIFGSLLLAADCAYQASELKDKEVWLAKAIEDLNLLAGVWKLSSKKPKVVERILKNYPIRPIATLLADSSKEAIDAIDAAENNNASSPVRNVKDLLQNIAGLAETLIPLDFQVRDDYNITLNVARRLANLSYRYGHTQSGVQRMIALLDNHIKDKDFVKWLFDSHEHFLSNPDASSIALFETKLNLSGGTERISAIATIEYSKYIVENRDRWRAMLRSKGGRLWASHFAGIMSYLYVESLLRSLAKTDTTDISELFTILESLKAHTLLDSMTVKYKELPSETAKKKAKAIEAKILDYDPTPKELKKKVPEGFEEAQLVSSFSMGFDAYGSERLSNLITLEELHEQFNAGFDGIGQVACLGELMQALRNDEVFIEYFIPHHPSHPVHEIWVFAITSKEIKTLFLPIEELLPSNYSNSTIGRLRTEIVSKKGKVIFREQPIDLSVFGGIVFDVRRTIIERDEELAQEHLKYLYGLLINPLITQGIDLDKYNKWIIAPYGPLHYIPFAALKSPEGFLIERIAITIVPSASVWLRLQAGTRGDIRSMYALGAPVLGKHSGQPLLKYASEELAMIESKVKNNLNVLLHVGKDATPENFVHHAAGKDIVHMATHGYMPEVNMRDEHSIILSKKGKNKGLLTAETLRQTNLQSAKIVILSICNSGLYRYAVGDEPYGIIPALLTAGAQNVLATLWPTEDKIAKPFMLEYYRHLVPLGPSGALQKTCVQFISDKALIKHWAAFALVGAGRPFQ